MKATERIFEELEQIQKQYRQEVGSNRRPWPESVRERIAQLRKLGLTYQAITDRTGISYFTIQNWSTQIGKRTSGFHQLAVVAVESKPSTVTVPAVTGTQEKEVAHLNTVDQIRPGTVTATTPDGYKLQLNDLSAVVQIIGELRKQKR